MRSSQRSIVFLVLMLGLLLRQVWIGRRIPSTSYYDDGHPFPPAPAVATPTTTTTTTIPSSSTPSCPPPTWRIVVTGNLAYEQDFLNWWKFCHRVGLCPSEAQTQMRPSENDCHGSSFAEVWLVAEDEKMYQQYQNSTAVTTLRAWTLANTKFQKPIVRRIDYFTKRSFATMMSRRPAILQEIVRPLVVNASHHHIQFILFMDLDTVILQDPRPYFETLASRHSTDFWAADAMRRKTGPYNAGMLVLRPTQPVLDCLVQWRDAMEGHAQATNNQLFFNQECVRGNISVRHELLPLEQFPVGGIWDGMYEGHANVTANTTFEKNQKRILVSQQSLSSQVILLHNNHCAISQNQCDKIQRLQALGLWNPAKPSDVGGKNDTIRKPHVAVG